MQAVINLHSCVSVSNRCNDKNKTKELLERDTSRYRGGHHKEVISIFHGLWSKNIHLLDRWENILSGCDKMYAQHTDT